MSSLSPPCPPPAQSHALLSYPSPLILLVTLNRPLAMNALPFQAHWDLSELWSWFDDSPTLLVAILTGAGSAFCAGQDLKEVQANRLQPPSQPYLKGRPPSGFGGMSQRKGRKPIIAAVNGVAFGGGFEMCLNCDIVIASPHAQFALPEARRGLYASAGGLPRLVHGAGIQIASEIALTGRSISAEEGIRWLFVNRISKSHETLLEEAITLGREIARLSPDAVIATRGGLRDAHEMAGLEETWARTKERYEKKLYGAPNMLEGLAAFMGKREPKWVVSNL
ncbi:hypothetical protein V501_05377 [Pseudogymnoascus sp. VKM F-4519 (FW-2642)]|nr:hypothetical protein V501_05377 [Pseudogymnoascus sp. VKM F-4519 (FW-2642)]